MDDFTLPVYLRAQKQIDRKTRIALYAGTKMTQTDRTEQAQGLSTEDWLRIAKDTLIREGVDAVKIDRLAKLANVTRGGFYWRFKSRQDILDQLLADWRTSNTAPILRALSGAGTPQERYKALIQLWIDEDQFIPAYDSAVRNWAAKSPKVATVVHLVDDIRMDALKNLFLDAGYDAAEATVRARITYFHQVGYYALDLHEARPTRAEHIEIYYRVLSGFPPADLSATKTAVNSRRARSK